LSFTELVSSWNADTPSGTWIQVEMRGTTNKGATTKWYVMGRWAYGDDTIGSYSTRARTGISS
jgi:hypothetical protein